MPLLKDVELRILLVVADQTLGWIEDPDTKRRKEKDWISQGLLMRKINRSDRAIQNSLKQLIDELRIIQAHDESGELLDSPQKRMRCGGKIFYRLSLKHPKQITPENTSGAEKPDEKLRPPKSLRAKKVRATKETSFTKKSYRTSELGKNEKMIPTKYFFGKFKQLCKDIRYADPIFVKHKDGKLLKHALCHLTEFQLELELIWFLKNKREMKASFGAALCKEVLGDFIKASRSEYGFYGKLEQEALHYDAGKKKTENEADAASAMLDALRKLKESFEISKNGSREKQA
jgi:hypothetical protein